MAASLTAGDPIADFTLIDTNGVVRESAGARKRGPLLYAFYTRTCGTCQYTFPFLQRFQDYYGGERFRIWGIAQENAVDAAAFARQYGATFPQLIDGSLDVSERYDLVSVPAIYLVGDTDRILRSAPAFIADELNAMSKDVADLVVAPYRPVVVESDNAPSLKPG